MGEYVLPLTASTDLTVVGGKGASLARVARQGLPVPPGFVVTTHAHQAVDQAVDQAIRDAYEGMGAVAVRSSATAEDLPDLSFAGQQDSFLNVTGADAVIDAVKRCWASLHNDRAVEYRRRNNIEDATMAVVVQELVPADASGVLFTANPVTGTDGETVINASWGLGESVVGGHVTPDTYVVKNNREVRREVNDKAVMTVRVQAGTEERPTPEARRKAPVLTSEQTVALATLCAPIGKRMDVEWTLHNGRFSIVQARPITNFKEQWNDTALGDFLWTSVNLGEAVPSVMTPMTWSLVSTVSQQLSLGGFPVTGNIGGRFYLNLTVASAVGGADVHLLGHVPAQITPPAFNVSKLRIAKDLLKAAPPLLRQAITYRRNLGQLLHDTPLTCENLIGKISRAETPRALLQLWQSGVDDLLHVTARTLDAGARRVTQPEVAAELTQLVGAEDAVTLLTGLGDLASLGPLRARAELRRGEIDEETYRRRWGHRCPDEFEVSVPRPGEDPEWPRDDVDADDLLAKQGKARDEAWARLRKTHPDQAPKIARKLDKAAETARAREDARSEMVRTFWVFRAFVLKSQELTGCDDLFFLTVHELVDFLRTGIKPDTTTRRKAYERYQALPVYPTYVRGAFDPEAWAQDPNRRNDFYDENAAQVDEKDTITGFPGMSGVVEGTVRVLSTVDDDLELGEILVTTVTNVGWTPLFPKAAAVVTDVGAPLSHAAIVARELGIPAVVGCGNATARLRTGDRVRVDGARGTVTLLT